MSRLISPPPSLWWARVTALTALVASTVVAGQGAASASPVHPVTRAAGSTLTVQYPVTGKTVLKSVNATVKLGPGKLVSTASLNTGALTATLSLPPATASFKQNGLIQVKATTAFIQDGKTTGKINLNTGAVTTTSKITIQVTKLLVSGLPVAVGSKCETTAPATVTVKSQKGFNIVDGGNLAGTYTIGKFAHCELATALLNLTVPGSGNTITLTLPRPWADRLFGHVVTGFSKFWQGHIGQHSAAGQPRFRHSPIQGRNPAFSPDCLTWASCAICYYAVTLPLITER